MATIGIENLNGSILLLGEKKGNSISWLSNYDDREIERLTEAQFASLQMKISRNYSSQLLSSKGETMILDEGGAVILHEHTDVTGTSIACLVNFKMNGMFNSTVSQVLKQVLSRGGQYNAKKFFDEMKDILSKEDKTEIKSFDDITPEKAIDMLYSMNLHVEKPNTICQLISKAIVKDLQSTTINFLYKTLGDVISHITPETDPDVILDATFTFANFLQDSNIDEFKEHSLLLFSKIIEICQADPENKRFALEIISRIRLAMIYKENKTLQIDKIKEILLNVDDGSLEVVPQKQREEYYVLMGFVLENEGDKENSRALYEMAVMMSEDGNAPSKVISEAYAKIAEDDASNLILDLAIQRYLTAATIATANNNPEEAKFYRSQSSIYELDMSLWIISHALLLRMSEKYTEATYQAWRSVKLLISSFSHAGNLERIQIVISAHDILSKVKLILESDNTLDEAQTLLTQKVIQDLENTFLNLTNSDMPEYEENGLFLFHRAQINTMIPFEPPTFLLIALDGRLMCGGSTDVINWIETGVREDLLSGALSAIMALLSEVTDSGSPLRTIDAGQTLILIERTSSGVAALLTDRDLGILRNALRKALDSIVRHYGDELVNWDGFSLDFTDVPKLVFESFKDISQQM